MPISTCTTFLIIVTWQFFYSNMKNYLCSQCPGWSLCWYKSEGLVPCDWARHHGGSLQCVCTVTDGRLFWFCLLWRLKTTFSLRGVIVWHFLDRFRHCFLATCAFFESHVSLASQTFSQQCRSHIEYEYWKRCMLWTVSLACETRPTVCKHN